MTRSGSDPRRRRNGSSPASRPRRALDRSSLWSEEEAGSAGFQPPSPQPPSPQPPNTPPSTPPPGARPARPQPLRASWDPVDRPRPPAPARPPRPQRRRSALGWFVHRYGWRAYAIPLLAALTVLVIVQVARPPGAPAPTAASLAPRAAPAVVTTTVTDRSTVSDAVGTGPGAPVIGSSSAGSSSAGSSSAGSSGPAVPPATAGTQTLNTTPGTTAGTGATGPIPTGTYHNLSSAALPPGEAFVAQGKGTWHVVAGTTAPMGAGPTRYTFTVEVEDGIENAQADQDFASLVDSALADPRSWIGSGNYTLQRIDTGTPSFRISLTSQLTVRSNTLCGWEIHYEASCYARDVKRVAINDARWARGAVSFNGDRGSYRVYAINHEVGHALGFVHQPCASNGGLAPVMMQQSWSTANNDLAPLNPQLIPMNSMVCRFNPYPFPLGSRASG